MIAHGWVRAARSRTRTVWSRLPEIITVRPSSCAVATAPLASVWPVNGDPMGFPVASIIIVVTPSSAADRSHTAPGSGCHHDLRPNRQPSQPIAVGPPPQLRPLSRVVSIRQATTRREQEPRTTARTSPSRQLSTDWPDNDLRATDGDLRAVLMLQRRVHQVFGLRRCACICVSVCCMSTAAWPAPSARRPTSLRCARPMSTPAPSSRSCRCRRITVYQAIDRAAKATPESGMAATVPA